MDTLSVLLALCEGNPLYTCGFSSQRASDAVFGVFFDVSLNTWLSKQSSCHWFDLPWHNCDITVMKKSKKKPPKNISTIRFIFWVYYISKYVSHITCHTQKAGHYLSDLSPDCVPFGYLNMTCCYWFRHATWDSPYMLVLVILRFPSRIFQQTISACVYIVLFLSNMCTVVLSKLP